MVSVDSFGNVSALRASVLIPSLNRPGMLERCLKSLLVQTSKPREIVVVWQGEDVATRNMLANLPHQSAVELKVLHQQKPGIVPAENLALAAAAGDIIFLVDDDAVAPPDWIERHLKHYLDPTVGAVGGPANNFNPDGSPFPKRTVDNVGQLRWFGRCEGNMYDHPDEWKSRQPRDVDHLVGYNFSFRRKALGRFDDGLRPYWQLFELEACLQIKENGLRIIFDFANRVDHYPTNIAFDGSRDAHLELRNYNPAYNESYVLSKHSRGYLRPVRLGYLLAVGTIGTPGLGGFGVALIRFRKPWREANILAHCLIAKLQGWVAGSAAHADRRSNLTSEE